MGVLLAVLFFVFGVGRREGFYYECLDRGGACGKASGCHTKCCSGEYVCRSTSDDGRCSCT